MGTFEDTVKKFIINTLDDKHPGINDIHLEEIKADGKIQLCFRSNLGFYVGKPEGVGKTLEEAQIDLLASIERYPFTK